MSELQEKALRDRPGEGQETLPEEKTRGRGVLQDEPARPDNTPPLLRCVHILLRLRGKNISINSLLSALPVDKGAFSPHLCVRAAARAGMNAHLVNRPRLRKINPLTLPCILVLGNGNGCVLTHIAKDQCEAVFPESPGSPRRVETAELQKNYTGRAVFIADEGTLDRRARDIRLDTPRRWFWGSIARFLPIYKHVVLASVVINLLGIAGPLFVMNVYDRVVPNNALETLWVLAAGVAVAYGFDFLLKNLRGYFVDLAGKNADVLLASRLMQHVLGIKLDHKPESTGTLANSLREFESLREFFSSTTLVALVDLPFLVFFIFIISFIGGPLAYAPAVAVPVVILVGLFIQVPFRKYTARGFKEAAQKNALLFEAINGLEPIKTSMAEGRIQKRWESVAGMHARSSTRTKALASFSITFSQFATQVASVVLIVWGVYRIAEGELTMGGLIACNILLGRAMAPLGAVAAMLSRLQQSRVAFRALNQVMEIPLEHHHEGESVSYENLPSSITFEKVTFKYPRSDAKALDSVSLHIRPREKVGVIGPIGSGKSTLARLILGLYTPGEGGIKIGGIDIRQMDVSDLRLKTGYVSQDNLLFYGSVKENIAFGAPFADDERILTASGIAGVLDFIRSSPAGFGLQVGERGTYLSGGQRQAVAIARALIHDPHILILDEPTSAMDSAVEARFKARLSAVLEQKTLLLISHRSSVLSLVDRLIVMDSGRIAADGPRDEVVELLRSGKLTFKL